MANTCNSDYIRARRWFLLTLLALFLYLGFLLCRPYLGTIIFAVLLSTVYFPAPRRLLDLRKGRNNLAALLSALVLFLLVAGPVIGFGVALVDQGLDSLAQVTSWLQQGHLESHLQAEPYRSLRLLTSRVLGQEQVDLREILLQASSTLGHYTLQKGRALLSNLGELFLRLVLMIVLVFVFLRDGPFLLNRLRRLSPLAAEQETRLIERVGALSRSMLVANMGTAAAQGAAGGLGLWLVGIPPCSGAR